MTYVQTYRALGTMLLIASSPALLAAKGCYFGSSDVPLGGNGEAGAVTTAGAAGSTSAAGIGSTSSTAGSGGVGGGGSNPGAGGNAAGGLGQTLPGYSFLDCGLPKEAGNCFNAGEERFWHNPATGQCEPFTYHCGRNLNNFKTKALCEEFCAAPDFTAGSACSTPPQQLTCEASVPRYYYDPRGSGTCVSYFGGCDESANSFHSDKDCLAACQKPGGATAVIRGSSCKGFGVQVTHKGETGFGVEGTELKRQQSWGCGCAKRAEFVMVYAPTSPVELRLCHDDMADSCEAACSAELSWDLKDAFADAGTNEFVFVD